MKSFGYHRVGCLYIDYQETQTIKFGDFWLVDNRLVIHLDEQIHSYDFTTDQLEELRAILNAWHNERKEA